MPAAPYPFPFPFTFPLPAHVKRGAPKTCCAAFNYAYQECGQCEHALPKCLARATKAKTNIQKEKNKQSLPMY